MNPTFILPGGLVGCVLCRQGFNGTPEEHLLRFHSDPMIPLEVQVRNAFIESMKDMKEFQEWKQRRDNS